ncbi:CD44 antigen isoform X2 [Cuculus canorus]|uniref:CD44 antigen isoform X2 n=1 Tax=Cuculus canorus TaxID=55661 RepID=UPI0023AA9455|nr:CD44 antigen isoform X2 [Cuculus canorus]
MGNFWIMFYEALSNRNTYGFVVGNVVIPRINPYPLCAANQTGIYKLSANTTDRYDAYCYNATETRDKTCEPIERLDTSFLNNQGEIVIDNADGSHYNADGMHHSGESSTSGADDENVGSGSTQDTTQKDTSFRRSSPSYYGSATPVSQLPDHTSGGSEKEIPRKESDYEVSPGSPDISLVTAADDSPEKDGGQYPASTAPGPHHDNLEKTTTQTQWSPFSNHWWWSNPGEKTQEPKQASKDVTSSGNGSDDEGSSKEMIYLTVFQGWDRRVAKDEYATSTTLASPDGTHHEDPTQPPLPSDNKPGQRTEVVMHPTDVSENEVLHRTTASMNKLADDSLLMGTITEPMDDVNREKATKEPLAPSIPPESESEQAHTTDGSQVNYIPEVFPDIEDHLNQLQTSLPTRSTSRNHGSQGPNKGPYESTTFPGETTTTKIASQPRSAHVPEWLIIVAALVALALILAACIAVNSRRRCGQKKKLVINNGKGAAEDRKTSGLNGDASKSQEMVHLVHKEQSNNRTRARDEFMTVNETPNHQDLDMKTGV